MLIGRRVGSAIAQAINGRFDSYTYYFFIIFSSTNFLSKMIIDQKAEYSKSAYLSLAHCNGLSLRERNALLKDYATYGVILSQCVPGNEEGKIALDACRELWVQIRDTRQDKKQLKKLKRKFNTTWMVYAHNMYREQVSLIH